MYDVTRQASFDAVSYWIKELQNNVDGNIVILVCGNKIDLEDQKAVESSIAQASAEASGCLFAECSASTGAGVERMFQLAVKKLLSTRNASTSSSNGVSIKGDGSSEKGSGCC